MRLILTAAALALSVGSAAMAQAKPAAPATTLELFGPAGQHRVVTREELAALPHVDATVSSHNVQGTYRGVPLGDVLRLVGLPAADSLRGAALAQYVLVEASDGYRVVFAPAELDAGFTDKLIFLADSKNGAPLDSAEGPFRMIAVGEKRPARWAHSVIRIRLVRIAP